MEKNLKKIAYECRLKVLDMVHDHKAGHIGGSMSCMDILTVLYHSVMDTQKIISRASDRDHFILSKGHCAEGLYAVLASAGIIAPEALDSFTVFGSYYAEHPTTKIPGIELATGALGHGVSAAVGMAIGEKANSNTSHTYVLTGDGELAEGSVWEAFMTASKFGLDNLTVLIDRNYLQISGNTEDVMPLGDLKAKLISFGMYVIECDGHNYEAIRQALLYRVEKMPVAVIAHTTKGKGSPVMESKADWHHLIPNDEQYMQIKCDLLAAMKEA